MHRTLEGMSEPADTVRAEDQPSWADVVRHAEHGETIDVLSDSDLVRELREGLADARAGRVFTADDIAADLAARRDAGA